MVTGKHVSRGSRGIASNRYGCVCMPLYIDSFNENKREMCATQGKLYYTLGILGFTVSDNGSFIFLIKILRTERGK